MLIALKLGLLKETKLSERCRQLPDLCHSFMICAGVYHAKVGLHRRVPVLGMLEGPCIP